MTALGCLVIAIIALVRVVRLERELDALRKRFDANDARSWRPVAGPVEPPPAVHVAAAVPPPPVQAVPEVPADTSPSVLPPPTPPPAIRPPIHDAPAVASARARPRSRSGIVRPPRSRADAESIERTIGGRLLLYAGMVFVVVAVGFFLRYAFEREWLSPAVRVSLGVFGGLAFVVGGQRLARTGYTQYGLFLSGGGFALLFLSVYAAFALYALIGQIPAFLLLVMSAAGAAIVADRHVALPLALMAVCGGFAAPFLVSTGADAQLTLFTYDAVLIAATMYLANRRGWPWLNLASFVWTFLTVTAWMVDRYTPARYLSTELFLTLYCAMFVAILRENLRSRRPNATVVSGILALAPVLYHVASVGILFEHGLGFLIYTVLASAAIVVASLETNAAALRFVGWLAVTMALAGWVALHDTAGWVVGSTVVAAGTWGLFLAPALRAAARREPLEPWDMRLIHSSGLSAFGIVYLAFQELTTTSVLAGIAAAFAAADVTVWAALRRRSEGAVHWLGLGSSLCAVAVAIGFEGFWTVVMWSAEAAALTWIGVRASRFWFRVGGYVLFAVAVGIWLQIPAPETEGTFTVLFNARALSGVFIVAMLYLAAALQRAKGPDTRLGIERAITLVAAHALTVAIISLEIISFWEVRTPTGIDPELARQLMLSSAWAIYAGAIIAVGMQRHYAPIRYFAMSLFGLTVLKVMAVDSQALDGIYRVFAFLVVGATLLIVAFLYQRAKAA